MDAHAFRRVEEVAAFLYLSRESVHFVRRHCMNLRACFCFVVIWTDIKPITRKNEGLGYPTQKPEALLDQIINREAILWKLS